MTSRYGITVPFDGVSLVEHNDWYPRLFDLGYSDVWTAEVSGTDGFSPLAMASVAEPRLNLGVAVVPAFTRGPGLLAQQVATMAEAAPGRFTCGLGTSSPVVVGAWNGIEFTRPYDRVRDTLRFLKEALGGEKVNFESPSFTIKGFRLERPIEQRPTILLGALRSGMLRLAAREADGAITNWLSADDVIQVASTLGPGLPLGARLFVFPTEDADLARTVGRRMMAAYLNVDAYADFQRWLGRGDALEGMWKAWADGDRKGALAAIDDETVDDLLIHGSPAQCRAHIKRYVDNGITIAMLAVISIGLDLPSVIEDLAPR